MSTYYVNGYNTSSTATYPYTVGSAGAPNLYTIFNELTGILTKGDVIEIFDGDIIDDTANDISIMSSITIKYSNSSKIIPIHIKPDGFGVNVYAPNVILTGLNIIKEGTIDNSYIHIYASDITIKYCTFNYLNTTGKSSVINISNAQNINISNNTINIPNGDTSRSYGIYANNITHSTINDNIIFMNYENGSAITFTGSCGNNNIFNNIIGGFSETSSHNTGIEFSGNVDYNNIHYNVIGITGQYSTGILYNTSNNTGKNVNINNNYIVILEDEFSSVGIFIPADENNNNAYINIINNIIEYHVSNKIANNSIAIMCGVNNGVIDFNDIYGFYIDNRYVNLTPTSIDFGSKNIFIHPNTPYSIGDTTYDVTDIRRYYCDPNSECIGSGYLFHDIGVGVNMKKKENNYLNIIDTVTDHFGEIKYIDNIVIPTFFNSVFTESAETFNNIYRNNSIGPYPSEDVYKNQFDFVLNKQFPYTINDPIFYNKGFINTLSHKRDLKPFDGIECPANPGYGYKEYKGYPNGLWGYPRISYFNNCLPDPCVIQDSYIETITIRDTIDDVAFWIQDMVNPPCSNQ